MATKKKMLQAAAGQAGGAALDITDVFSTYLYEGSAPSSQTITNGIDLAGEGGLVWIKNRDYTYAHMLHDTEATGVENVLRLPNTSGISYDVDTLTSFNSDGFTVGGDSEVNESGTGWSGHVSWTFRKAPKFFDVVTYTGDGTSDRQISHNLGSTPGMVIVKRTAGGAGEWMVNHRSIPSTQFVKLNGTQAATTSSTRWNNTDPTDTVFTVGSDTDVNASGSTYVAYLFAHNDGDGEFGPDGDQDIIKCGSYTSNSGGAISVDLGFEPQWILLKNTAGRNAGWVLLDTMRGFSTDASNNLQLLANADYGDLDVDEAGAPQPTSTGFKLVSSGQYAEYNYGTDEIIYIAIRRGPLAQPESATEVFNVDLAPAGSNPRFVSNFPVDLGFIFRRSGGDDWYVGDRLRGKNLLRFNSADYETPDTTIPVFDYQDGWGENNLTAYTGWQFRRAPGFFDVVAYTGDDTVRNVPHNLGVTPEMFWIKARTTNPAGNQSWYVWHKDLSASNDRWLNLNTSSGSQGPYDTWNYTAPTDTVFTVKDDPKVNKGSDYITYLFATLPGVSKVGSYTGNGSSQVIDCGFTSGARFVLIKRTDSTGDWVVFDTERGIGFGNDPFLELNTTDAENTSSNIVGPNSGGFNLQSTLFNGSGETYIFYAIA